MTCCCSLCLLYKVHAIEFDLQSQLHQVILFSHYSSTELSKEWLFLVEILQPVFQGLAPSRCHPFFRVEESNTWNAFWEPGDDHNEPSSTDVRNLWSCCFFVSNLLHSSYCSEYNFTVTVTLYFHENFMVDEKLQDQKRLSAYNWVLCIYNSCWSS